MISSGRRFLVTISLLAILILATGSVQAAHAQTTITAYQSQYAVNVKGPYQPSQWSDAPAITDANSGMTFAVKQNGTGWLFLMIWKQSSVCTDAACFGGIELGNLSNTQPMGSPSNPTIMILASTSFTDNADEFISTGELTPSTVESLGYTTQSVCGLSTSNGQYTVQCYRPFALSNASPYDFPKLGPGSTLEIGFAVGEFTSPGDHMVSDMSTYTLTFSNQEYTATTTTTSSRGSTSSTTSMNTSSSAPNVPYYWIELALIVAGFSYLIFVALMSYRRR
jgi:hypothetical protein